MKDTMYFPLSLKLRFTARFMCFQSNTSALCIVKSYILISVELFSPDYTQYLETSYKCPEYDSFLELSQLLTF